MPYVGIYALFFVLPWALGVGNGYALTLGVVALLMVTVAGMG